MNIRYSEGHVHTQGYFCQKNNPPHSIEAYSLFSNGPQFVHVDVLNRDGTLVSVSAIPIIVYGVCY